MSSLIGDWWNPARSNPHAAYVGPLTHRVEHAKAGPGIHTDEASSALPDMGHLLPPRDEQVLALLSPTEIVPIHGDDEVRSNPSSSGYSLVIAPRVELFPIAYLVTGTWGPDESAARYRTLDVREGTVTVDGRTFTGTGLHERRRLPMYSARENPRDDRDFFQRMHALKAELLAFRGRVEKRYADTLQERIAISTAKRAARGEGPAKEAPKDAWLVEIDKMLHAVEFLLAQEEVARRTHHFSIFDRYDVPFGLLDEDGVLAWGPLAKGNAKLSFYSYSELPMSSCPGAGECGVSLHHYENQMKAMAAKIGASAAGLDYNELKARLKAKKNGKKVKKAGKVKKAPTAGWCYSFKAFRRGAAFTRMFLNTLANTADREAAIWRAVSPGVYVPINDSEYGERVRLAIAGAAHRRWQGYVKQLAVQGTSEFRAMGKTAFIRLFVDGDIGYEDSILAWMQVCREIGPGGVDVPRGAHIEAYGYSKCWNQFLNADRILRSKGMSWPANYTVNQSSGSVYAAESSTPSGSKNWAVKTEMARLPITRGEFVAVDLKSYVPELRKQTEMLLKAANGNPRNIVIPAPKGGGPAIAGLNFKPERIRDFLLLQSITTRDDVLRMFPDASKSTLAKKTTPEQLVHYALTKYLDELVTDPTFGAVLRREVQKDTGKKPKAGAETPEAYEKRQVARLKAALWTKEAGDPARKKLNDKAIALVLHETLWSFGLGGSCPLVCGNCSDHPSDPTQGVHRCASKSTLLHRPIAIGLH